MELRSTRQRLDFAEYKELKITLSGLGFYEDGMDLQEMRDLLEVLQQSITQSETSFLERDMERAFRDSELDFVHIHDEVHNSTMISANKMGILERSSNSTQNSVRRAASSPFSSPETPAQTLTVQVEVHHAQDWIPPPTTLRRLGYDEEIERRRLLRKRTAATDNSIDNESEASHIEQDSKRSLTDSSCSPPLSSCSETTDSGYSLSDSAAGSSAAEYSAARNSLVRDFQLGMASGGSSVVISDNEAYNDDDQSEPSM